MAEGGLAQRSVREVNPLQKARKKPVSRASKTPILPVHIKYEMERRAVLKRLKQTEHMEDVLAKFAKEVKARFPQSEALELRLDNSMPSGLCVDVSVNQGYDPAQDAEFESWFVKESRKVQGLLIYTLQYL